MYVSELRRSRRKSKRNRTILVIALAALFLLIVSRRKPAHPSTEILAPVPQTATMAVSAETVVASQETSLEQQIRDIVGTTIVNYSVLVKPVGQTPVVDINSTVIFPAASVNKMTVLAALYSLIESGDVDPDTSITIQANDVQDYGTGSIRYDKPGTVYSVKTLAQLMIQKSDNTAEYVLANHVVGLKNLGTFLEQLGLQQTNYVGNETSNADMGRLIEKLYSGGISSAGLTKEMLGFMKDTDFEDRIPALLPDNVSVYHKIGNGDRVLNDVGVVEYGGSAYYIGLFTNDIMDETETMTILQAISKTVFDAMQSGVSR